MKTKTKIPLNTIWALKLGALIVIIIGTALVMLGIFDNPKLTLYCSFPTVLAAFAYLFITLFLEEHEDTIV